MWLRLMEERERARQTERYVVLFLSLRSVFPIDPVKIALKCADICNPCRPWKLSKLWSEKVTEEFFHQGTIS